MGTKITVKAAPNAIVKTKSKKEDISNRLQDISPDNPMPFEGGTGITYLADAAYIPFLSAGHPNHDRLGKLLLETRLLSVTHNLCITTKKNFCAGLGLQFITGELSKDQKYWLRAMNYDNESFVELNKQIFESFFTFGNAVIEVIRLSVGSKKQLFIHVHNFLEWRLCKPEQDGTSRSAVQSKLFLQEGYSINIDDYESVRRLPIYNPRNKNRSSTKYKPGINWIKDVNGSERTIIWYKNSVTGFPNYGLPSSFASLINGKLEYKVGRFNLDTLDNNAVMSALLVLHGNLTETEINKVGNKFVKKYTGDGKRGRVMVVGSEEGVQSSDLHALPTATTGSFREDDDKWSQKIFMANEWDPLLAGVINPSTLGKGTGFISKILELKRRYVIIPAQADLMDNVWSDIFEIANEWSSLKFPEIDNMQIKNIVDISGLTDVDITAAVTVDEVRLAKDLPKAKDAAKGAMFLGELGAQQKKGVYVADKGGGSSNNNSGDTNNISTN